MYNHDTIDAYSAFELGMTVPQSGAGEVACAKSLRLGGVPGRLEIVAKVKDAIAALTATTGTVTFKVYQSSDDGVADAWALVDTIVFTNDADTGVASGTELMKFLPPTDIEAFWDVRAESNDANVIGTMDVFARMVAL